MRAHPPNQLGRWRWFIILAVLLVPPALACGADPQVTQTFRADFARGEFDVRDLALNGGHAEELVHAEPAGLRIKIPPNLNKPEGVGVRTRYPIRGDFNIAATFDIIRADKPTEGYGIGAQMSLETDTPGHEAVTSEWTYTPGKEGIRFISTRILTKPNGERDYRVQSQPVMTRSGTVRLVRTGASVQASYREDDGRTERILAPVVLGTEDVTVVRIVANTGVSDLPVEIRLKSFTVAAGELPGWSGASAPTGPVATAPSRGGGGIARPIGIGVGVMVVVGGLLAAAGLATRTRANRPTLVPRTAPGDEAVAEWDDATLTALEARAEAFAREHPTAEVFFEPGQCQFTLRNGAIDGPVVVWWRVEPDTLKQAGQTWDDLRKQLPKRYRGRYHEGQRDGTFQGWDSTGGTVVVVFRAGVRV